MCVWAYLGIKTPLLHNISRSPKGWSPRMYWRGIPFERARHMDLNKVLQSETGDQLCHRCRLLNELLASIARSRSQRSSFRAELIVRHSCKSSGRRQFCSYAFIIAEVEIRGIGEQVSALSALLYDVTTTEYSSHPATPPTSHCLLSTKESAKNSSLSYVNTGSVLVYYILKPM